jgi:hypothetical protein
MNPRISDYLRGLGQLCIEVAATPALLPVFLAIIKLAPGTILQLRRDNQGRMAA